MKGRGQGEQEEGISPRGNALGEPPFGLREAERKGPERLHAAKSLARCKSDRSVQRGLAFIASMRSESTG